MRMTLACCLLLVCQDFLTAFGEVHWLSATGCYSFCIGSIDNNNTVVSSSVVFVYYFDINGIHIVLYVGNQVCPNDSLAFLFMILCILFTSLWLLLNIIIHCKCNFLMTVFWSACLGRSVSHNFLKSQGSHISMLLSELLCSTFIIFLSFQELHLLTPIPYVGTLRQARAERWVTRRPSHML